MTPRLAPQLRLAISSTPIMSYAPTAEELKQWSNGPIPEVLFGNNFPLARDHPDWQKLEQGTIMHFKWLDNISLLYAENDQWVEENWQFDDKELRGYLMSSQLGPFSSMCKARLCCSFGTYRLIKSQAFHLESARSSSGSAVLSLFSSVSTRTSIDMLTYTCYQF